MGLEELVHLLVRPPRLKYRMTDLGPQTFEYDGNTVHRMDIRLKNSRGQHICCSWYIIIEKVTRPRPCVLYLHGNAGGRPDSLAYLQLCLHHSTSLFTFDFAGCGKSEGDHITLGKNEQDDVACVMRFLNEQTSVSSVVLFGRSMGAVTALLYASALCINQSTSSGGSERRESSSSARESAGGRYSMGSSRDSSTQNHLHSTQASPTSLIMSSPPPGLRRVVSPVPGATPLRNSATVYRDASAPSVAARANLQRMIGHARSKSCSLSGSSAEGLQAPPIPPLRAHSPGGCRDTARQSGGHDTGLKEGNDQDINGERADRDIRGEDQGDEEERRAERNHAIIAKRSRSKSEKRNVESAGDAEVVECAHEQVLDPSIGDTDTILSDTVVDDCSTSRESSSGRNSTTTSPWASAVHLWSRSRTSESKEEGKRQSQFGAGVSIPNAAGEEDSTTRAKSLQSPQFCRKPLDESGTTKVSAVIVDSPFSSLYSVCQSVINSVGVGNGMLGRVVQQAGKIALPLFRKTVISQYDLDIKEVDPLAVIGHCSFPVLFVHAIEDDLVPFYHGEQLYDKYGTSAVDTLCSAVKKQFLEVAGGHNDIRPAAFYTAVSCMLNDVHREAALRSHSLPPTASPFPSLFSNSTISLSKSMNSAIAATTAPSSSQITADISVEERESGKGAPLMRSVTEPSLSRMPSSSYPSSVTLPSSTVPAFPPVSHTFDDLIVPPSLLPFTQKDTFMCQVLHVDPRVGILRADLSGVLDPWAGEKGKAEKDKDQEKDRGREKEACSASLATFFQDKATICIVGANRESAKWADTEMILHCGKRISQRISRTSLWMLMPYTFELVDQVSLYHLSDYGECDGVFYYERIHSAGSDHTAQSQSCKSFEDEKENQNTSSSDLKLTAQTKKRAVLQEGGEKGKGDERESSSSHFIYGKENRSLGEASLTSESASVELGVEKADIPLSMLLLYALHTADPKRMCTAVDHEVYTIAANHIRFLSSRGPHPLLSFFRLLVRKYVKREVLKSKRMMKAKGKVWNEQELLRESFTNGNSYIFDDEDWTACASDRTASASGSTPMRRKGKYIVSAREVIVGLLELVSEAAGWEKAYILLDDIVTLVTEEVAANGGFACSTPPATRAKNDTMCTVS